MSDCKSNVLMVLLFAALYAFGCAARSHTLTGEMAESYPATTAESVQLLATTDRGYQEIGGVAVSLGGEDTEKISRILKEEAAKLGADAVINLELSITAVSNGFGGSSPVTCLSGMAIKFK